MAEAEKLFVVRLWDGFDYEWYDVTKPVPRAEADEIWNERTDGGTKMTSYSDIDYYAVFPADTVMMFSEEGKSDG